MGEGGRMRARAGDGDRRWAGRWWANLGPRGRFAAHSSFSPSIALFGIRADRGGVILVVPNFTHEVQVWFRHFCR